MQVRDFRMCFCLFIIFLCDLCAVGRRRAGRVGGRAADTARRASTVTSR